MKTVPVTFTKDELWGLQAAIRHDMPMADTWTTGIPPADKELNRQIADALLSCEDSQIDSFTLELDQRALLIIDHNIRKDLTSDGGIPIGKRMLVKTFRAQRQLDEENVPEAREPAITDEQKQRMDAIEKAGYPGNPWRSKRVRRELE